MMKEYRNSILISLIALILLAACSGPKQTLVLNRMVQTQTAEALITPTQTPWIIEITSTPEAMFTHEPTQTPKIVEIPNGTLTPLQETQIRKVSLFMVEMGVDPCGNLNVPIFFHVMYFPNFLRANEDFRGYDLGTGCYLEFSREGDPEVLDQYLNAYAEKLPEEKIYIFFWEEGNRYRWEEFVHQNLSDAIGVALIPLENIIPTPTLAP